MRLRMWRTTLRLASYHRDDDRGAGQVAMGSGAMRRAVGQRLLALSGALATLLVIGCSRLPTAPADVVPREVWQTITPAQAGWSPQKLEAAHQFAERIGSSSVMVISHGEVLAAWGLTTQKRYIASARKSMLSALIGRHVQTGEIDLASTLDQLGIDDILPSLTPPEKQATVADLLTSRSGIYHIAESEELVFAGTRPQRGSHAPGSFYFYNNWDFNALGTIFEQQTHTKIGDAYFQQIAGPLQMQDFQPTDIEYLQTGRSVHPAYHFFMTARDMARFGLLYLRHGTWGGQQVVPSDWVTQSTALRVTGINFPVQSSEDGTGGNGYGYMWWVANEGRLFDCVKLPPGSFAAEGSFATFIIVMPAYDLVIVHRGRGGVPPRPIVSPEVSYAQVGVLLHLLLDAAGAQQPSLREAGC